MKKGSMSLAVLASIILALIGGFVLVSLNKQMASDADDFIMNQACSFSIATSTKDKLIGKEKIPDFDCLAARDTISKEDFTGSDADNYENLVKRKMANKVVQCWYTVGAEENQPYPSTPLVTTGVGSYCLICNIIDFEDISPIQGLDLWMVRNKPTTKDKTYFQHLYSRNPDSDEMEEFTKLDDVYDTSAPLAVIWKSTFMHGTYDDQEIEIVPYYDLSEKCTIVMN